MKKVTSHIKTLIFILWNMMAFLCPIILQYAVFKLQPVYFSYTQLVSKYFLDILFNFKEFINKIILKNKNNNTAKHLAAAKLIHGNQKSILNKFNANIKALNNILEHIKNILQLGLKDAPATQNLISKQHIFRIQDKCAFLYPFAVQNYHCINCL